jgi:hypothetical protein
MIKQISKVTNAGRRPVFVSHATLVLPKEKGEKYKNLLLLTDTISGDKLNEGDPPKVYQIDQDGLEKYAKHWNKIYVQIEDSTGKTYNSKTKYDGPPPSWAKGYENKHESTIIQKFKDFYI